MIKKLLILLLILSITGCSIYQKHSLNIYNPDRITKKQFGTYVTPWNSPIESERFTGYHTGIDFETFEDEADTDIPVYAICDGPLVRNVIAKGYGGVIVQSCIINNEKVNVVYGHIDIESVPEDEEVFVFGDFLGNLGEAYTNQTDGERKHLHLSIHKGIEVNLLGYVQDEAELSEWIDPWKIITFSDDLE